MLLPQTIYIILIQVNDLKWKKPQNVIQLQIQLWILGYVKSMTI